MRTNRERWEPKVKGGGHRKEKVGSVQKMKVGTGNDWRQVFHWNTITYLRKLGFQTATLEYLVQLNPPYRNRFSLCHPDVVVFGIKLELFTVQHFISDISVISYLILRLVIIT